jgi:hypothetical protein
VTQKEEGIVAGSYICLAQELEGRIVSLKRDLE